MRRCTGQRASPRCGSRPHCPLPSWSSGRTALRQACDKIGRVPIPTRMSFRVEFSTITGNAPSVGRERLTGHGTPVEVAGDLLSYREKAGLDAFQINFHGNRNLDQLLQSMEYFMKDVAPLGADQRIRSGTSDTVL
jgi:hypothetical protein